MRSKARLESALSPLSSAGLCQTLVINVRWSTWPWVKVNMDDVRCVVVPVVRCGRSVVVRINGVLLVEDVDEVEDGVNLVAEVEAMRRPCGHERVAMSMVVSWLTRNWSL
eukprot:6459124-Amphidinium_carterae.3